MYVMISDYDSKGGGAGKICEIESIIAAKEGINTKEIYAFKKLNYGFLDILRVMWTNIYLTYYILKNKKVIKGVIVHTYSFFPSLFLLIKLKNINFTFVAHDYSLIAPCKSLYHKNKEQICKIQGYSDNCMNENCGHNALKKQYLKSLTSNIKPDRIRVLSDLSDSVFKTNNQLPVYKVRNVRSFDDISSKHMTLPSNFILFVGRYSYDKGYDLYLELAKKNPSFSFYSCGSGVIKSTSSVTDLGWLSEDKISYLISNCSLVIYPSRQLDADPLVIQQCLDYNKVAAVPSWNASAKDIRDTFGHQYVFDEITDIDINKLLELSLKQERKVQFDFPTKFKDLYVDV